MKKATIDFVDCGLAFRLHGQLPTFSLIARFEQMMIARRFFNFSLIRRFSISNNISSTNTSTTSNFDYDDDISTTSETKSPSSWTIVYADGSCKHNGTTNAVAGIGVYFGENDRRNVSRTLPTGTRHTSQRAELTAAIEAISAVPIEEPLEIRTDSSYVVKGLAINF